MTRNFDHIDPGNSGGSTIIPELPHFAPAPKNLICDKCDQEFVERTEVRSFESSHNESAARVFSFH